MLRGEGGASIDLLGPDGRVARLAGDEFALLMDAGEADEVMRFAVDLVVMPAEIYSLQDVSWGR